MPSFKVRENLLLLQLRQQYLQDICNKLALNNHFTEKK